MLHLIGIGYNKKHINFEMHDAIKNCSQIYLEHYTSYYETDFNELSEFLGKEIEICSRETIESEIEEKILKPSKEKEIALLILGDPLVATTHTDLLLRCSKLNVEYKIYNNISVANLITRTGLQFYKFGRITSIPFFSEKFMPRTPFIIYSDNHRIGAHSLFLLDLDPNNENQEQNREHKQSYLKAFEALQFLLDIPKIMIENEEIEEKDSQIIDEETTALICSRLGFSDENIIYDTIGNLIKLDKLKNFKEPLCIIIHGDLHDMEEKYLNNFKLRK